MGAGSPRVPDIFCIAHAAALTDVVESDLHLSAEQVDKRRSAAFVRDLNDLRFRSVLLNSFTRKMADRAIAGRAEIQLPKVSHVRVQSVRAVSSQVPRMDNDDQGE